MQLQKSSHPVTLLTRLPVPASTEVFVKHEGEEYKTVCSSTSASSVTNPDANTALLVTTKAYDTINALRAIEKVLPSYRVIVLMQNGMGIVEQIRELYPGLPLVMGITNQGVYRTEPFHVVQAGIAETWLGCLPDENRQSTASSVADLVNSRPDLVYWDSDILMRAWIKLGINCVINGLTVVLNCPNGELLDPVHKNRISRLCQELAHIISAQCRSYTSNALIGEVLRVATATEANISSMRQDVLHNRQTEIDHLNGFVCELADSLGIAVPENLSLLEEIRKCLNH
jgi:2-dehydropantoate 2-reductase